MSAFQLGLGLRELGHKVVFATRSNTTPIYEARFFPGSVAAPTWRIPDAGGYLQTGIAGSFPLASIVARICRKREFDLIHAHNWISAYAAHRARSSLPKMAVPWVLSLRDYRFLCPSTYGWCFAKASAGCGLAASTKCIMRHSAASIPAKVLGLLPYAAFRNVTWRILTRSLSSFDAFVCCSTFLKLRFREMSNIDRPLLVVHNPTEIIHAKNPEPLDGEEILYLGRLSVEKGVMVLLSSFRALSKRRPGVRLLIVGSGPMENKIRHICSTDPILSNTTKVVGRVRPDKVEAYYRRASVVVTPSIWPEPLGRVPLEAMGIGRSVVASSTGGIPEVVEQGKTGLLVPPGNSEELLQALEHLLSDPKKRAVIGRRGIGRARLRFSRREIALGFVKVYEDLIQSLS